ncbi:secondary thiamine-phosphate synthase enzyme YjbQ [Bacillus rubiinfantis]|uniref:secondary thiamine-phosphate synthase enzyme YjbQ n=1 Tax=Bacillus rubiinfantis TaxID=1499680 RepID=UPI000ABA483F|nr:secondary thiamine-phosphate synthase enzyme YjbQ [Bacillus rubiinfantis]
MIKLVTLAKLSQSPVEMINITDDVHKAVEESGIINGLVAVITAHTTTGITVNESLECVETDMLARLEKLVPNDDHYIHAHFLPSYGATSNNSPGHLKSMLLGNNCLFPIKDGKIMCGSAQAIYLVECDGPQRRKVYVQMMGE